MMKKYATPEMKITVPEAEDVITASITNMGDNGSGFEDGKNLDEMF